MEWRVKRNHAQAQLTEVHKTNRWLAVLVSLFQQTGIALYPFCVLIWGGGSLEALALVSGNGVSATQAFRCARALL